MLLFKYLLQIIIFMFLPLQVSYSASASPSPIHKILLVVAMDSEAQPIIKALHLQPLSHSFSNLPMRGYVGKQEKTNILLMINGEDPVYKVQNIGTEAATLSTYLGVEFFHPDLIISIGTAGGVIESGAALRDVYISQKIYFIDRRIPMKGYFEYGRGAYESLSLPSIAKKVGLRSGIVCSEGSFDEEQIDYKMFLKERCSAIDMEAAGVAWVSMLTKTPMFALKGVTNYVRGEHIHDEFKKNLPIVTEKLAQKLKQLIRLNG